MKRILVVFLAILFLLGACAPAGGIEVREAWARPAAQGENGAIYFVIRNQAREADELTGVSSGIAEAVEMHESRMDGDVMQMHQLASVSLQGDEEVTFEPGGLHIMLIGLKKDLKIGDEIEVTLHFKNFEETNLLVPVREAP
ncbi:MAG TPA: copper chaperone PCu(A)C, partial [Anaerolineales bacterium]|nr:copper chaperone PCu(A)C [Anaerolineales bacterium]